MTLRGAHAHRSHTRSRRRVLSNFRKVFGAALRFPMLVMIGGISPLAVADPTSQRVGRRPQTTEPIVQGGPFMRHTKSSRIQMYTRSGVAFGGIVNEPLKAVPGYIRYLDVRVTASGGEDLTTPAVAAADAPWNVIQTVLFKDAFGQPLIQCSGYALAQIIAIYSGQHGFYGTSQPSALPSFTTVNTDGNFTFRMRIPFELFDGFCAIPGANQSAIPSLTFTIAGSAQVYATPPDTLPTIEIHVEAAYYAIPLDDPSLPPPQNGSSHQWQEQTIAAPIGTGSSSRPTLPPLGSYVTTLALIFRDADGVRTDTVLPGVNAELGFWVDGVPTFMEERGVRRDLMFQQFGVAAPSGVIVYTFRDGVANFGPVSAIDSGDLWLPTTPGSLLELAASPWGTFAATPAQVTVLSGRVYSTGGIPYTHLAD